MKVILAYIPVLHQGYRELFELHSDAEELWVLGYEFADEFKEIRKDIRRLDPELVVQAVEGWNLFNGLRITDYESLKSLDKEVEIVVPDDVVMREIVGRYLSEHKVTYSPIFLRWDRHLVSEQKVIDSVKVLSSQDFDKESMKLAFDNASQSTDWWRHVGAVLVKDREVVSVGWNRHLPTENATYLHGDPRALFSSGIGIEFATSIHAEAGIIARAAREGVKLAGTSMYVTDFPCPVCARQIAEAGIKKLFFAHGYSLLDGLEILYSAGVEVVQVEWSKEDNVEAMERDGERSILFSLSSP